MVYGWPDLTTHPIIGMVDAGLRCMLNSDDPTMFHTDIGNEYVQMVPAAGWGLGQVRELMLNGVEATWLDDSDKATMRRVRGEFDRRPSSSPTPRLPAAALHVRSPFRPSRSGWGAVRDPAATLIGSPARVAQTAEQLTRNEQVRSSILLSGSSGGLSGVSSPRVHRLTPLRGRSGAVVAPGPL